MSGLRYEIYLHNTVSEQVRSIRGIPKRTILDFLDCLQSDPFLLGDFTKHLSPRDLEVKVIGQYSLYYYADHAAKEIKVIELLRSDQA